MYRMGYVHRDISSGNCFIARFRELWGMMIKKYVSIT